MQPRDAIGLRLLSIVGLAGGCGGAETDTAPPGAAE